MNFPSCITFLHDILVYAESVIMQSKTLYTPCYYFTYLAFMSCFDDFTSIQAAKMITGNNGSPARYCCGTIDVLLQEPAIRFRGVSPRFLFFEKDFFVNPFVCRALVAPILRSCLPRVPSLLRAHSPVLMSVGHFVPLASRQQQAFSFWLLLLHVKKRNRSVI
jgi:hypothetical protein